MLRAGAPREQLEIHVIRVSNNTLDANRQRIIVLPIQSGHTAAYWGGLASQSAWGAGEPKRQRPVLLFYRHERAHRQPKRRQAPA